MDAAPSYSNRRYPAYTTEELKGMAARCPEPGSRAAMLAEIHRRKNGGDAAMIRRANILAEKA